jgi:hypothetical protein
MTTLDVDDILGRLKPGTTVGHANPELAGWAGTVTPDRRGQYWTSRFGFDVRVKWAAGLDGYSKPLSDSKPSWCEAASLTVAGQCPDCARPAHYLFAGNPWDRGEGWHHDARVDMDTCWAGKAAYESGSIPGVPAPRALAGGDPNPHFAG